ncbi:cyclodeaminase/cyclohydrolase family protein [Pelotomaculum terephthalicicum JT]|uniref:cyclodeaminase/cyclohydrolase family protein n=1 Tax=Pelotomaculum TaxID=191373 RepID=UPI0009D51E46|nr:MULTISPECIES: cyclodeaminase/cyclohydrolase family protein [Pelotomaculum]MCG9968525.1 cyclodeaminase/cyclohydrolase family protein [Pelotomaculum terephthalicicum JT]OPX85034.1 MAG: Methenyltetrahydrofolate cyclohydrolase [Pelotomaculum sp. PtaB.Bin117]OPY62766.1 MAG: Methenyltetrahydrofolate cyclohydrolase [Pelotomaculum sp. PtaU1.Bin065]
MSALFDKTLREVIELSASSSPAPGGGSVSAIVACFGLAMTAMVCNLTTGKKKYREVEPQVNEIISTADNLMRRLEELVDRDMAEFNNYMRAFRMPKETDAEKATREEAMQKALVKATETPLDIARVCLEALRITARLSGMGNKTAISDAGVAAVIFDAAVNGVLLSAEINAAMIEDQDYVKRVIEEKEAMAAAAGRLKDEAVAAVRARIKES